LSCGEVVFFSGLGGGLARAGGEQAETNSERGEWNSHGRIRKIRPSAVSSARPKSYRKDHGIVWKDCLCGNLDVVSPQRIVLLGRYAGLGGKDFFPERNHCILQACHTLGRHPRPVFAAQSDFVLQSPKFTVSIGDLLSKRLVDQSNLSSEFE